MNVHLTRRSFFTSAIPGIFPDMAAYIDTLVGRISRRSQKTGK